MKIVTSGGRVVVGPSRGFEPVEPRYACKRATLYATEAKRAPQEKCVGEAACSYYI